MKPPRLHALSVLAATGALLACASPKSTAASAGSGSGGTASGVNGGGSAATGSADGMTAGSGGAAQAGSGAPGGVGGTTGGAAAGNGGSGAMSDAAAGGSGGSGVPGPWSPAATFGNPVLWDDLADDEVIRVGSTMINAWQFFLGYRFAIFDYATQALGGFVNVGSFDLETP